MRRLWLILFLFVFAGKVLAAEEKPFVVVIASYNNSDWCERNLRSIFEQKYDNYRVIYINDSSTDDTLKKVQRFVKSSGQEHRFTLINNETNQKAVANYYRAIHSCHDDEIVVMCDGDDWFLHEWVLEKLNEEYADADVWMTYGNYLYYPSFKRGDCFKRIPKRVIRNNAIRVWLKEKGFVLSHLKTCYAGLFKRIKLEDVLMDGKFIPSTYDAVFMVPMAEMAGEHIRHIKQPLYANNRANVLNDDRVGYSIQQKCWDHVKAGKPYQPIKEWRREEKREADCVVFSFDRPLQLYALLESMQKYVKGARQVSVIYRVSDREFDRAYCDVISAFPEVVFVKQGEHPEEDFKPLLLKTLKESPAEYVMFAVDDMVVKDAIDCVHAMEMLEATGAEGFFFRLGKHVTNSYANAIEQGVPEGITLADGVMAWQYAHGKGDWWYPLTVDMTLYKKRELMPLFEKKKYAHPGKLEEKWAGKPDYTRLGLCYETSKVVNIPLNLVLNNQNRFLKSYSVSELLKTFEEGKKMDISPLFKLKNTSAHIEYEPTFIPR